MSEMTYTDWLEKELNIYKRANKLLNDSLDTLNTVFNEVHDNELETRDKKNDILKWGYSLEKENKKLKQQIEGLTSENFNLQNSLYTQQLNEDEADNKISKLENDIDQLKNELFNIYKASESKNVYKLVESYYNNYRN